MKKFKIVTYDNNIKLNIKDILDKEIKRYKIDKNNLFIHSIFNPSIKFGFIEIILNEKIATMEEKHNFFFIYKNIKNELRKKLKNDDNIELYYNGYKDFLF